MKRESRTKLGLLALLILGGELVALLVLFLSGPVSAAFAPYVPTGVHSHGGGSGSTLAGSQDAQNSGHGGAGQKKSFKLSEAHDHFIFCLGLPSFCEGADIPWPNNFPPGGPQQTGGTQSGHNGQGYAYNTDDAWPGGFRGAGGGTNDQFTPGDSGVPGNSGKPSTNTDNGEIDTPADEDGAADAVNPGTDKIDIPDSDPTYPPDLILTDTTDPTGDNESKPGDENSPGKADDGSPPNNVVGETPAEETLDIPEPISISLFASGLAGLLVAHRRRKNRTMSR